MAVATHTVTVNAAFLQEIKDDNLKLRQLLLTVRQHAARQISNHGDCRGFVALLGELRDQLAIHFALEEAYGYFDDAIAEAPRLSEQAEALRAEHQVLFAIIRDLAEKAEQRTYRKSGHRLPRSITVEFLAFDGRLRQHEGRENELILQAFDDDIGVGD